MCLYQLLLLVNYWTYSFEKSRHSLTSGLGNVPDFVLTVTTRTSWSGPRWVLIIRPSGHWQGGVRLSLTRIMSPMRRFCLGSLHLLKRWRALRYSVDQRFQKCWVSAWQSLHRFKMGTGVVTERSGKASSGWPIRKWAGVRGAIPSSLFGSSYVSRGLELRQATRFKWCLQALTRSPRQTHGGDFKWMLWLEQKLAVDSCVSFCLRKCDSSFKSLSAWRKQVALSLQISNGFPLRETKRRRAPRKASAVRSETSSMWQDSVARQTKTAA